MDGTFTEAGNFTQMSKIFCFSSKTVQENVYHINSFGLKITLILRKMILVSLANSGLLCICIPNNRTLRLDKKYQSIVLSTILTRQRKLVTGSPPWNKIFMLKLEICVAKGELFKPETVLARIDWRLTICSLDTVHSGN